MNRIAKFYDRPIEDVVPVDDAYIDRLKQTIRSLEQELERTRGVNEALCHDSNKRLAQWAEESDRAA